ncbi:MAG TPA: hypothetical protein DCP90_00480 [Clostridiales bacterium]|nr:MAG: hypothetical protein A2Y22_08355 [Clostridiales bacterium GWD2_32_59]HAN09072.1 hypothetical protein [Clostridiales bacterium]
MNIKSSGEKNQGEYMYIIVEVIDGNTTEKIQELKISLQKVEQVDYKEMSSGDKHSLVLLLPTDKAHEIQLLIKQIGKCVLWKINTWQEKTIGEETFKQNIEKNKAQGTLVIGEGEVERALQKDSIGVIFLAKDLDENYKKRIETILEYYQFNYLKHVDMTKKEMGSAVGIKNASIIGFKKCYKEIIL